MRVALVHNPNSGSDKLGREGLVSAIEKAGHEVSYHSKDEIDAAVGQQADLIAAAGGDGTIAKVMKKLARTRNAPLTILPLGTANNIAKSLGLVGEVEALIDGWTKGSRGMFSLPSIRMNRKNRLFVEGFGLGIFPEMLAELKRELELGDSGKEDNERAHFERLLAVAQDLEPVEVGAEIDGDDASGKYLLFEVMNIRSIGPNLLLSTRAHPAAPRFEIAMLREDDRDSFVGHLAARRHGKTAPPEIRVRQAERVRFRWSGWRFHVDDKLGPRPDEKLRKRIELWFGGEWIEMLLPPPGERRDGLERQPRRQPLEN